MTSLEQELKDLCAEGNNSDYYLAGYIDASLLEEIIQKYLDPDYKYYNKHWGKRPTVDREPNPRNLTVNSMIRGIYESQLRTQLARESEILKTIFKD